MERSRISQGRQNLQSKSPITLLRDIDQPFVFEIRSRKGQYRFEFYDTSSPENWKLLRPDLVIICYDISQRLSLINLQRVWIKEVRSVFPTSDVLPVLVLGLKRDLRSEDDPNGIIYPQEGYQAAQAMRVDKYIECSAVTGELMTEAFDDVCSTALQTTTPDGGQSEGGCMVM
jgi:Ras family protein A